MADYQNPYTDASYGGLSPEAIAARRRYAYGLMQQAGDGSPTKANAIGAIARALQGAAGGYMVGQADKEEMQGINAQGDMLARLAGGGSPNASLPQSTVQTAQPMGNNVTDKIYRENEPSPLDPPSGQARDLAIRTIYGEDPGKSALGVANVIRNRAVNGGFGGDTVPGVVLAKNQFEPWNNIQAKARMLSLPAGSPEYNRLGGIVDQAYTGANDPTNGATSFYSPTAQAALGRSVPSWARGPALDIGEHRFYGGAPGQPTQLAGPIPSPDSSAPSQPPPPQVMAGGQPAPQIPQQQGLPQNPGVQQLISTIRDPNASIYAKRAASTMLQGVVTKQLSGEWKPVQQPDGSMALVNSATGEIRRSSDPGMAGRVGALKASEAEGTTTGTNRANVAAAPELNRVAAEKAGAEEEAKLAAAQRSIKTGGLTSSGDELKQRFPLLLDDAEKDLTAPGGWIPKTGQLASQAAIVPGTPAANLQAKFEAIRNAAGQAYEEERKAASPTGRPVSPEAIADFKKQLILDVGDPKQTAITIARLKQKYGTPAPGAIQTGAPSQRGAAVAAPAPLKSGTYDWSNGQLVPR
jgi:hypothetical protein